MTSKKISFPLIFMLFLGACIRGNENESTADFIHSALVSVELSDGAGEMLRLQKPGPGGFESLDSFYIKADKTLEFSFPVDKPGFFSLRNAAGSAINFMAYGGDSIFVKTSYYNFWDYELRGSEELEELSLLNEKTQEFLDILDEIARITRDSIGNPRYTQIKTALDLQYRESFASFKEFSTDLIKRNEGRLITLLALTNQIGHNFFVFHPVNDMDLFLQTDSLLFSLYPDSDPVIDLHRKLAELQFQAPAKTSGSITLQPGQSCPDFSLPSPSGSLIRLSSLSGKVVLIDFWASWCPPCRRANPILRQLYENHKNSGFEVLQISLDQSKDKWLEAIKTDSLNWMHASDLRYWESDVVKNFGIRSIPFSLLLDHKGIIIMTNPSPDELEKQLIAIFNKK